LTDEPFPAKKQLESYCSLVHERLDVVRARIVAAGGDPAVVRVVGVTKTFGPDAVIAASRAGITDIGENYADELVYKARLISTSMPSLMVKWHFLGGLQRNKINRLRGIVGLFEGIDRFEEGEALARRSPGAAILVEVDTTHTPGRGGVLASEVPDLVNRLSRLDLRVEGLMTVAPPGGGETAAKAFREVANLRKELGLREASMGMSEDLELAVAEGSTMVRIGRALFGPRPQGIRVSQ
jgi:hypothetical protein